MNRVLGDDRRDLLWDIFDDAFAGAVAALEFAAAAGADFQAMIDTGIDLLWRFAAGTFVPLPGPRLLAPPFVGRRLLVHGNLARGRGGQGRCGLQLSEALIGRQQRQANRFGSHRRQLICLRFAQLAAKQCSEQIIELGLLCRFGQRP